MNEQYLSCCIYPQFLGYLHQKKPMQTPGFAASTIISKGIYTLYFASY